MKGFRRKDSRWVRRLVRSVRRRRRTIRGSRWRTSRSPSGSRAATTSGYSRLVSFQGSHDIGRVEALASVWGGKLGRNVGHPIEQGTEQDLAIHPGEDGVVT